MTGEQILLIFFSILFIFMLIDDKNIQKDINAASKTKFTKNDYEICYEILKQNEQRTP